MDARINGLIPSGFEPIELLFGILIFAAVLTTLLAIRSFLDSRMDVVERRMQRYSTTPISAAPPPLTPESTPPLRKKTVFDTILKPVASIATPTNQEEINRLRDRLNHAGYRQERAMRIYLTTKMVLAFLFAAFVIAFSNLRPQPLQNALTLTLIAMSVGNFLPNFWLQYIIQKRQTTINRALPDALDLLVTCIDSGLGLDASMNRVAEEISLSAPLLSQEIMQAALEIRAGSGRGEAFRRLATRTGVEDIKSLASIIVQTEVFGTSMAKALRIMADGMRIRRMQLAEERAAKVGVKMTVPLVVCILPALFAIIIGPAVVQLLRSFGPASVGGK
jgi:tight adherence protein C